MRPRDDSGVHTPHGPDVNSAVPLLDVSAIPFWRRLSAVTQALDDLPQGSSIDLSVDLDPWPLKMHLDLTRAGMFGWRLLEDGPLRWTVRVTRT